MKKIYLILFIVLFLILGGGLYFMFGRSGTYNVPAGYKLYNIGQTIDFSRDGNSAKFVDTKMGWGGQETKHRCFVGSNAELSLYVPDITAQQVQLFVHATGVFKPDTKCQNIDVYVNDTLVEQWCMGSRDIYVATIPANIITSDALNIRFVIESPYVSPIDARPLGAAVREIYLEKKFAQKTRKKVSRWVQDKLFGNKPMPEYGMQNKESETKTNAK